MRCAGATGTPRYHRARMVFSSVTFLFFFLPAVLIAYYLVPHGARNALLVLASLVFYTWGAGWIVLVLIASIGLNGLFGLGVERSMEAGLRRRAQVILAVAIVMNVGLLAWFKYANFTIDTVNGVLAATGGGALAWTDILLPIGISFYTFHSLSYLVDIYRGAARHLSSPIDFALYITFFPQLVAGPIVRFHEIRDQLVQRTETIPTFAGGVYRFCHGLGKKVLIADTIAPVADAAFAASTAELTTAAAVLGVFAYAVQLYFDFSGYSDMALGLAMMFGIHLPENFARPYAARSITEFWRRWHMSLSRWFRDYLYISLGGNRGTALATYRNLVFVFLVTGLWHGAAWTFVAWGAYHGVLLLIERALGVGRGARDDDRSDPIGQARTVGLVLFGWILFRSPDIGHALGFMGALARPGLGLPAAMSASLDPLAIIALAIGCASVLLPRDWVTGVRLERASIPAIRVLRLAVVAVVFPAAVSFLVAGDFSPFLYFQF
jgi:alginate O-acetyltransferase complex protein AlgI